MADTRQFRVLRNGVSVGIGTAREARDTARRGDIIQNVYTGENFSWWTELYRPGDHDKDTCPACLKQTFALSL